MVELKLTLSGLKSYSGRKPLDLKVQKEFSANKTVTEDFSKWNCLEAIAKLASLIILSNTVYTRR